MLNMTNLQKLNLALKRAHDLAQKHKNIAISEAYKFNKLADEHDGVTSKIVNVPSTPDIIKLSEIEFKMVKSKQKAQFAELDWQKYIVMINRINLEIAYCSQYIH
jgi:hypothetical protein